jgi:hypothetical protein
LLSALLFAAVSSPFITALSMEKGRLTFGDGGRLRPLAQTACATMPVDGLPAAKDQMAAAVGFQSMGLHAGDPVAVIGDGMTDDRRVGAARAAQGCGGDLFSRRRETASSGANHGTQKRSPRMPASQWSQGAGQRSCPCYDSGTRKPAGRMSRRKGSWWQELSERKRILRPPSCRWKK